MCGTRRVLFLLFTVLTIAHALPTPSSLPLRRSTPLHRMPCRLCPGPLDLTAPDVIWHMFRGVMLGYAMTDMLARMCLSLTRRE